ncbi:hypothetical protein ACHAWF_015917 [Thalassiosira exigua]
MWALHGDYDQVSTDDPEGGMKLVYNTLDVIAAETMTRLDRFKAQDESMQSDLQFPFLVDLFCDVATLAQRTLVWLGASFDSTFWHSGWGKDEDHKIALDGHTLVPISSLMLTLTVSRLQREVSKTFDRIGFDNVLEHIIDSNEIQDEYGISLPPSPKEFLSIGIASLERKVGIEVDRQGHFVRLIDELIVGSHAAARPSHPQEMSNTVWSLATAGFGPRHPRAFDTTLVPASRRPSTKDVRSDPITECFAAVAGEAMRRPWEFKDQELKDVLWSFSKIGVRHPLLFKSVAKHIVGRSGRGFSTFSSQGLGNTLWSFAKQAQLSLEVIESLGDRVKLVSTGRLAVYETSCLDNGEDVIKRLFVRAAEAALAMGLDRFKNQDLSNTVWAYSTLGMLHSKFFKATEQEVVKRLKRQRNGFRGQEIANIYWSFATLNARPDPTMVDELSSNVASVCRGKEGVVDETSIAKMFGQRQELANLAWSCAVIGRYPEELMRLLYAGLLGSGDDPDRMKRAFNDDGLQQSSIMTLYYVQVAADVEAPELRLSLPKGFPNGWGEDEDHEHAPDEHDLVRMSSSMLTLTVSRLQREVSKTFDRIGFDNVLEHVIDTNEIQDEYGISLPPSQKEFLSIDIVNVEQKVGIEVDGPGHFVRLIDEPRKESAAGPDARRDPFGDRGENRVNGPTILKHRLLTHLGWDIVHLPYWEYQDLAGDEDKEREYCLSLLDRRDEE